MTTKPVRIWNIIYSLNIITFGMLLLIALSGCGSKGNGLVHIQPSSTVHPTATYTRLPTNTSTPEPIKTSIPPTPTPGLGIGSVMVGNDGMTLLYVPAGEFRMGSENGDINEKPVHTVNLDGFWIDQTEVTNGMYAKCIQDEECGPPSSVTSYSDPDYANHPVVYVSWLDAMDYCSWADRRLPTEAEWEKAARGTDGRTYPWGEEIYWSFANYNENIGDTTPVGDYHMGVSPYGAYDMAGNVWEWVADWYDSDYYASSPEANPTGPESGDRRVLRGGSWFNINFNVRSAYRYRYSPAYTNLYISFGFRCASSP